jgi:hypothetical protein
VTGRASLTLWMTQTNDIFSIDLWEEGGKIRGRTSFGTWGIVNLSRNESGAWVGQADDGFVNVSCTDEACDGIIGSDTFVAELGNGGETIKGALNHVRVTAKNTDEKIRVYADGSLELRKIKEGVYTGSGTLGSPLQHFTARLKGTGTLTRVTDPAVFSVFLISPFVRN